MAQSRCGCGLSGSHLQGLKARQRIAQGKRAQRVPPWVYRPTNHPGPEGAADFAGLVACRGQDVPAIPSASEKTEKTREHFFKNHSA